MKTVKYIGQILAALVYTCIYVKVMVWLVVVPLLYFLSLSAKWMIIVSIFLGGVILGLILFVKAWALAPFAWILKNNKCALWISVVILVALVGYYVYDTWDWLLDHETKGIIVAVIISMLMLHSLITTAVFMFSANEDDDKA